MLWNRNTEREGERWTHLCYISQQCSWKLGPDQLTTPNDKKQLSDKHASETISFKNKFSLVGCSGRIIYSIQGCTFQQKKAKTQKATTCMLTLTEAAFHVLLKHTQTNILSMLRVRENIQSRLTKRIRLGT